MLNKSPPTAIAFLNVIAFGILWVWEGLQGRSVIASAQDQYDRGSCRVR
ncbi:MAG: hypothetical protein F6J96_22480 [Symploca sp. SIO1C2]|nr:hypothetical protein [Symploca sp. SIO1C2]